jgi:hypothetical protein
MEVGFISLGHVGAPMALNLLKAGQRVTVYQSHDSCERPASTRIAFSTFCSDGQSLHPARNWPLGRAKRRPLLVQAIFRYVDTSQGIVGHLDDTLSLAGRSVDL